MSKVTHRRSHSLLKPDVVVGLVVVAVQDAGRQPEELQLLPSGFDVVEGVELHGGLDH